jgi:arabinogalactan oligomer/maltooligosaccharide transport system permease protein
MSSSSRLASFASHACLVCASIFALYPLLWVLSAAFSRGELSEAHALPLPRSLSGEHFQAVLTGSGAGSVWFFVRQLGNSLFVSAAAALGALVVATPGAYALSRFRFLGREAYSSTLSATQMFPGVAAAIPLYLILDATHLLDTRTGLVLVYAATAVPFSVFQLRAAFDAISVELEEAALVDGASRFEAFVRIVLPAARPALAVTALFAFMGAWNEFILAATFLSHEDLFTLPIVLQRYVGEYDSRWGPFAAGAILVSVPVMALFFWLQRHIVSGLTAGGVKG